MSVLRKNFKISANLWPLNSKWICHCWQPHCKFSFNKLRINWKEIWRRASERPSVFVCIFWPSEINVRILYDAICYYNTDAVPIAKRSNLFFPFIFLNVQYCTDTIVLACVCWRYFQMMGKFMGSHRSIDSKMPRKQTEPNRRSLRLWRKLFD